MSLSDTSSKHQIVSALYDKPFSTFRTEHGCHKKGSEWNKLYGAFRKHCSVNKRSYDEAWPEYCGRLLDKESRPSSSSSSSSSGSVTSSQKADDGHDDSIHLPAVEEKQQEKEKLLEGRIADLQEQLQQKDTEIDELKELRSQDIAKVVAAQQRLEEVTRELDEAKRRLKAAASHSKKALADAEQSPPAKRTRSQGQQSSTDGEVTETPDWGPSEEYIDLVYKHAFKLLVNKKNAPVLWRLLNTFITFGQRVDSERWLQEVAHAVNVVCGNKYTPEVALRVRADYEYFLREGRHQDEEEEEEEPCSPPFGKAVSSRTAQWNIIEMTPLLL
jgi:hypothetical protein